jgi:5-methylcytosine-specific restriction protein A
MPRKAPRPCRSPGCPKHAEPGGAHCAEHAAARRAAEYARRGSAASRGYDSKWQRERLAYLKQNPICVECKKAGHVVPSKVVDHIVPHKGDQKLFWNRRNWQALCKTCHDRKTAREDGGFANPRR